MYEQACSGGDSTGCTNAGLMYDDGRGVSKDSKRAAVLFTKGCDGANARACAKVGRPKPL
jgi:TPR repeat protein